MYQEFFGLRELPFELTPNPRFLVMTTGHLEALGNLEYGLSSAKALTLLIGEAGTGKTTLLHAAFSSESCRRVQCVYINNPSLTREEFVETLAMHFELSARAARSKSVLLAELQRLLKERRANEEITALVMDEAQSLSIELLEEVRLLANIETETMKLLPLVLVGQPKLAERLELPELRQLKQRVTLRCEIAPLELLETYSFIAHRIKRAGGSPTRVFTREAVALIHEHSGGIPRTICVICDNALVSGYALGRQPVDRNIVLDVCRDFALRGSATSARPEADLAAHQRSKNESNMITGSRPVQPVHPRELGDEESRSRQLRWFGGRPS
jgi:type II secretory pathway predicted ATPase ExeA